MASDVMRVRLHLRQIRVLAVVVDTPSELAGAGRVDREASSLPALRVQVPQGARHPRALGARP